jgi:hypothetical protein
MKSAHYRLLLPASVRHTSVDQPEALNAATRIALGVSVLRALGPSACARMSK